MANFLIYTVFLLLKNIWLDMNWPLYLWKPIIYKIWKHSTLHSKWKTKRNSVALVIFFRYLWSSMFTICSSLWSMAARVLNSSSSNFIFNHAWECASRYQRIKYIRAALRIHLILTWIRILRSTFENSWSSDPPLEIVGNGSGNLLP